MTRPKRVLVATGLSALAAAAFSATPALAGTVSVSGGELLFSGGAGQGNDLTVERLGSSFRVTDDQNRLVAGTGCTEASNHRSVCAAGGVTAIDVTTASGDDFVLIAASTAATVHGGSGLDVLTGGTGPDRLIAGGGSTRFGERLDGAEGPDELLGPTTQNTFAQLVGGAGADTLSGGPGGESLTGGEGADDLSGGGSTNDDVSYGASANPVTVTLGTGANDGAAGEGDNVHADIESVVGSPHSDLLIGSDGNDHLFGSGGDDELRGGAGFDQLEGSLDNDTLRGEEDADTLSGSTGADRHLGGDGIDLATYDDRFEPAIPISVSLNNTANDGAPGEGDDVRSDVENVRTGAGADTLIGNALDNELQGSGGADQISGGGGDDRLLGDGFFPSGTDGDDTLKGDGGDDLLRGGGGGDALVGGADTDQADYSSSNNPLTITVGAGANDGEAGEGDNVADDIDVVVGGSAGDDITGGPGPNVLFGGGGSDDLNGAGGDDLLDGENPFGFAPIASDVLTGGNGADTASYRFSHFNVTASLNGAADDGQAGENDNVLTSVENLIGTNGFDTLIGSPVANALAGQDGFDTLEGRDGADHLTGGRGDDTHEGQGGNDRINSRLDGSTDTDNCGGGTDSVVADSFDNVNATDCENVDAP